MCGNCKITVLLVLGLLLTSPRQSSGQQVDLTLSAEVATNTKVSVERLGEFLARNLVITASAEERSIGETEKNLIRRTADDRQRPVALRIELISRQGGMVTHFDSKAVQLKPGEKYHASRWIPRPAALGEVVAASLRPAEFVVFRIGQKTNAGTRTIPRGCGDATHAVLVAPRFADGSDAGGALALCFDGGR